MVSIVSGNGLGLSTTSFGVLGPNGTFGKAANGQSGEGVYVNAATGNLVLQRSDDLVIGLGGMAADTLRTYNSQGVLDGDNNDNWKIGFYKKVASLTGTVNTS